MAATDKRTDPFRGFNFRLEIDGRATWVLGADQDEARRLAVSITETN